MKNFSCKLLVSLFLLLSASALYAADGAKATKSVSVADLVHSAPNILPDPGSAFELVLNIKNSKVTDLPARLLLNSDGRLMELNLLQARFNNQEVPEYRFQVSAPLAELQYQFVVLSKDGAPIKTQYFSVRRKCIPQILSDFSSLDNPAVSEAQSGDERLSTLVGQARSLEFQIDAYERAGKMIDEIKALLGNKEQ